jgi:hypothetical protein
VEVVQCVALDNVAENESVFIFSEMFAFTISAYLDPHRAANTSFAACLFFLFRIPACSRLSFCIYAHAYYLECHFASSFSTVSLFFSLSLSLSLCLSFFLSFSFSLSLSRSLSVINIQFYIFRHKNGLYFFKKTRRKLV